LRGCLAAAAKPQTLGYGLNDSPAGLAAWILEKWRSWADSRGDLDGRFSREFLLTILTIYWVTQTITPSMRDYYDNRWFAVTLGPDDVVDVPTGIAVFKQFVDEGAPPREWAERLYDVRRWTPMPSGGHFAPAEEPERLARDIAAFFAASELTRRSRPGPGWLDGWPAGRLAGWDLRARAVRPCYWSRPALTRPSRSGRARDSRARRLWVRP
jgi:pimeloyl-ACP methyl ester carboxylesterase